MKAYREDYPIRQYGRHQDSCDTKPGFCHVPVCQSNSHTSMRKPNKKRNASQQLIEQSSIQNSIYADSKYQLL